MDNDDRWLREAVLRIGMQVAVDGPAGSGKSTVARGVADSLAVPMLDTGLMYRAVTWLALRAGVAQSDGAGLGALASRARFGLTQDGRDLTVNGESVASDLQSPEVDAAVSAVSAHPSVRTVLVEHQRQIADRRAIVMVGRDIGTVVIPRAPVKLWVTAAPSTRAQRRIDQRREERPVDVVEEEISRRDYLDSTRPLSPLVRASDAVELATDSELPDETVRRALAIVANRARSLTASEA